MPELPLPQLPGVVCPSKLTQKTMDLSKVREALIESDLPIQVEIVDWQKIPEAFHTEIKKAYIVITKR